MGTTLRSSPKELDVDFGRESGADEDHTHDLEDVIKSQEECRSSDSFHFARRMAMHSRSDLLELMIPPTIDRVG